MKNSIKKNTEQCNSLNDHIEELKNTYVATKKVDYGQADYNDLSRWNYKRPEWKKLRDASNIYNCSLPVCSNAKKQPFKYLCKYFDIKANEENLTNFESILNDFSAAEQGKVLLKKERDETVVGIRDRIPFLIRIFSRKKLLAKLGFDEIDFSQLYFPRYSFKYVSAGGNSSTSCDIVLDIENLDKFVNYLAELVKFRKSVAGQRALMTSRLREEIKKRDAYRCKRCGVSVSDEPNLLLEIDHITPLSRGGMTTEKNLQTLCWRCNRSKGAKLVDIDNVPV
ncbi:HNH endonuclease [Candidatus Saccharibacteria bacterium]|nr:HNH endonuclease [Candidatus Saccharibacteria bacterium]